MCFRLLTWRSVACDEVKYTLLLVAFRYLIAQHLDHCKLISRWYFPCLRWVDWGSERSFNWLKITLLLGNQCGIWIYFLAWALFPYLLLLAGLPLDGLIQCCWLSLFTAVLCLQGTTFWPLTHGFQFTFIWKDNGQIFSVVDVWEWLWGLA